MAVEINVKDFVINKTKPPEYLQELFSDKDDITLVFLREKPTIGSSPDLLDTFDSTSNTTLNLTGRPLEIDLNVTSNSIMCESQPYCKSETNCRTMNISVARRFNNHYNRQLKKEPTKPRGVYCVCDATDGKNTVVLGSHVSTSSVVSRTVIFCGGSVEQYWCKNVMDQMLDQHITNAEEFKSKIQMNASSFHNIYGHKLDLSHNLETTYNSGYVAIEAEWNSNEFDIPKNGALLNLLLQVVTGHENSLLHPMYQKLTLLQNCINVMKSGALDDNTVLCNALDFEIDVYPQLKEALLEVKYMKMAALPQDMVQVLACIDDGNLTDKFWNILSGSSTLGCLKDALNKLFANIENLPIRLQILDEDLTTALGNIIKNIYEGKMMVPTLSTKQALILLIEIGLQKLKKAFMVIVKLYDIAISGYLNNQWSKLSEDVIRPKNISLDYFNVETMKKQLDFLYSIYTMLDFVQLVEQSCTFSKEVSISVLKNGYDKFSLMMDSLVFSETKQLLDLELPVTYDDVKLATDCPPLKWKLKMTSVKTVPWYASVTTVFHYSRMPIFPENVYKYKDAEFLSDSDQKYFITQMETYSDKLPV